MDRSCAGDSDPLDKQNPERPATLSQAIEHEFSGSEAGSDSVEGTNSSSDAVKSFTAASDEEAGSSEGRKEPPDSPGTRERRKHAAANAELNSGKHRRSFGPDGKVRGAYDSYTRRESITIPFRKVEKLVHRRRGSKEVEFDKKVKVKETDGERPEEVPRGPVFEEQLGPKGEVPNKAAREAARVAKAQREHEESISRRIAKSQMSRNSSTESLSPGIAALHTMNQISGVKAVDDLDQLRISRGQTSTIERARAGRSPERRSTSKERGSSTQSSQCSGERSSDRVPSAARTDQPSDEPPRSRASSTPSTRNGQAFEQPSSRTSSHSPAETSQANRQPSSQSGQSSRESAVNRENDSPASHVTVAGLHPRHTHTRDQSNDTADNSKPQASDNRPPSDHVVNAQFGIVYHQDPAIAIQSLGHGCSLLNNISQTCESVKPTAFAEETKACDATLRDVTPAQTQRHDQRPNGSHGSIQDLSQRGFSRYFEYCLNSLDELGEKLWPDSDDVHSLSDSDSSESSRTFDDVDDVLVGMSTSYRPAIPATTEESYACSAASLTFDSHKWGSQVDPQMLAAATFILSGYEATLTENCFNLGAARRPKVHGFDLFGKTLEEAYSTYCMTHCPRHCPPQSSSALAESPTPANPMRQVTQPLDSPSSKVISERAILGSENEVNCNTRTKRSWIKSWLNHPTDLDCEVKDASHSQVSGKPSASSEAKRPAQPHESNAGSSTDGHVFTPVEGSWGGVDVASDKPHPNSHPFCRAPDLTESHDSRAQFSNLSTSNSAHVSPQCTPTRTMGVSPDLGLRTMCGDVLFGILPLAPKRSSSNSTGLSELSVITALNDLEKLVPGNGSSHLDSLISGATVFPCNDSSRRESVHDAIFEPDSGSLSPCLQDKESSLLESHQSQAQKRSGSGLSIITSLSSHSKTSGKSKNSARSGGSSGSSGSSSLPYGLDGTSKSWRPHASKTQASVGIDQDFKRSEFASSEESLQASPKPRLRHSGPSTEAMKKFIMKHSPTKADRCAAENPGRVGVRKVVKKRSSLLNFFGGPLPELQEPQSGPARDATVEISARTPEPPSGSDSDSARTLTVGEEDLSPPLGDLD